MTNSIPASALVSVNPGVLSAGGSGLDLIGLFLTTNTRVPLGAVQPFASPANVGSYFGLSSQEYAIAQTYFAGFDNSNIKPGSILFAQYPTGSVGAYLRGGNVAGLSLTQLQALSGSLSVAIDGTTSTASALNLSAATSFSNAAELIEAGLGIEGALATTVTASITGTVMTVTGTGSGMLASGQVLMGTSVTAGTYIVEQLTGTTGGNGTYTVSVSQTVASETITAYQPAVTYDSVSGAFVITSATTGASSTLAYATGTLAASLGLTLATGAVVSQGAVAATPNAFMSTLVQVTTDWATFTTLFDPDNGSGNTQKLAFAAWNGLQNDQFFYACWDPDQSPATTVPATSSLGQLLAGTGTSGTMLIWATSPTLAAFIMGTAASIDFTEQQGRITFAFKGQSTLAPNVTNQTVAANLIANGYNFYGAYATANQQFRDFYPGSVTGPFEWADSYINQIWLNSELQLALMTLLSSVKSLPYNARGYALVMAACADPIAAALNFGAIQPGVPLSALQAAEVNNAAGIQIDQTLSTRGWYLQVSPASAQTRASRKSPPCTLWYMDGGSIQQISLASIEVQ